MATLYVYDDEGTLERVNVAGYDSVQQAAKDLIDHVIDWTNIHGGAIYPVRDCQAHMDELGVRLEFGKNPTLRVSEPKQMVT
ncbi:hypothetical protein ACBZ90_18210 (plasmid) [Vibrio alginolyticus]